jgi:hypothetical protein
MYVPVNIPPTANAFSIPRSCGQADDSRPNCRRSCSRRRAKQKQHRQPGEPEILEAHVEQKEEDRERLRGNRRCRRKVAARLRRTQDSDVREQRGREDDHECRTDLAEPALATNPLGERDQQRENREDIKRLSDQRHRLDI